MKKSFAMASLASLAILSSAPIAALADPIGLNVVVNCPVMMTGTQPGLSDFGNYVAGYGSETISYQQKTTPYFKSTSLPDNMPSDLSKYSNFGTSYDVTSGTVTCTYAGPGPQFSVAYTLTHGNGASVIKSTNNSIELSLPVGVKA